MNEDGVVWALNFVEANKFLPRRLKRILAEEGSDTATVGMLDAFDSPRDFDRLARNPFVVFLEPPSLDPRIVNQFALFSLMSSPEASLDDWLAVHPTLARRIIVRIRALSPTTLTAAMTFPSRPRIGAPTETMPR